MKREKGSITVFICILLSVLIPLCGILMDLARYNEAVKMAQSSLKLCTESMLAAYDRQLKEQFGLLAMHPRDVESMEKEIYELLSDNLTPETAGGDVTDLYRFKVRRVEVIPIYNLSEPYVLEQQVTEFMKYRAPIQAVGEFLEKLKTMTSLAKEGEIVERNMALDKILNDIRVDMIYFALLLDQKMENINNNDGMDNFASITVGFIERNNENENNNKPRQETIDAINEKMDEYREIKPEYDQAETAYRNAETALDSVKASLDNKKNQLENAKNSAGISDDDEGEENGDKTSGSSQLDSIIQGLEKQISDLEKEYTSKKSAYDSAKKRYEQQKTKFDGVIKSLNELLNKVLDCYNTMYKYTDDSLLSLYCLKEHLALHENYCTHAIELGQSMIIQAQQIQDDTEELESAISESPDSAVAQQINADLDKKLLSVDAQHIGQILEQLENNKDRVSAWLQAVTTAYDAYLNMSIALDAEIKKIEGLINNKGDGNTVISMYAGNDLNTSYHNDLKINLRDMDTYSNMKSRKIYVIPEYKLIPPATEKEQKGFDIWHANAFEGESIVHQEESENPDLQNARGKTGDTAAVIAEGKDESQEDAGEENQEKGIIKDLDDIFELFEILSIPSRNGVVSSDESLARISEHAFMTEQDKFVLHNPLEDPIEGVDTVNEEEKGFFDNALESIRSFFSSIGDLMKDAGESLIKSVYMNEYIVSAFKNYTTVENVLENDIGWLRPLDKTFFDKAEVEYIIFGQSSEESNIAAARRSITVIRLIFNLLHVYSDPEKLSITFNIASSMAGWTIIGVPIVQNFLLVSWAAAESWLDTQKLMEGEQIPLIKFGKHWFLQWQTFKDYLINNVIESVKDFVVDKSEELIDEGAKYLEETVMSFINGQLDVIFSSITENWYEINDSVSQEAKNLVGGIDLDGITNIAGDTVESFLESLREYMVTKLTSFCESIRDKGSQFIAECRKEIQDRIYSLIFQSNAYKILKDKVKGFAKDTIEKGFDAVSDKVYGVLGSSGGKSSGANNVLGRLIMMDYTDYLRLMLLTVTPEQKALRCSDLIQLNMYTALPDSSQIISNYHTALYVKAWIDIDLWVIPEEFYKNGKEGMIVVEWAQGY